MVAVAAVVAVETLAASLAVVLVDAARVDAVDVESALAFDTEDVDVAAVIAHHAGGSLRKFG